MVKMSPKTLENGMIGLIVVFALISFFGSIASLLADSITNVTSSTLQGVAVFGVVGILITLGVLLSVMRGLIGSGGR